MRVAVRLLVVVLLAGAGACAADGPGPAPNEPPFASVVIRNRSQFIVEELRIHRGSSYDFAEDLLEGVPGLEGKLPIEGRAIHFTAGTTYVTFFREHYARGPIIAFTTSEPIHLEAGKGYELILFDELFRLEPSSFVLPAQARWPILGEVPRWDCAGSRFCPEDAGVGRRDAGEVDAGVDDDAGVVDDAGVDDDAGGDDAGAVDAGEGDDAGDDDAGVSCDADC